MKSKLTIVLVAITFIILLPSCEQQPPELNTCTPTKIQSSYSSNVYNIIRQGGSVTSYNNGSNNEITFSYAGANKVQFKKLLNNNNEIQYVKYSYSSSGKLDSFSYYSGAYSGAYTSPYASIRLAYNSNNKLGYLEKWEHAPASSGVLVLTEKYHFNWSNDNITSCTANFLSTGQTAQFGYSINSTLQNFLPNIFSITYEPFFDEDNIAFYPLYLNKNAITQIATTVTGNNPTTLQQNVEYVFSPANANVLKEIKIAGAPYYKFYYDCVP